MEGRRKEHNRGKTVSFVVDSEEYSVIDLEKDIASEFKSGSDQQPNFWVLTNGYMTSKLASDAQLLDLLRASRVVKLFMIVGSCEHNVREKARRQRKKIIKSCGQAELEQELPPPRPKKQKKQRKTKSEAVEVSMIDVEISQNDAVPKVMSSLGVRTRSMSAASPTSPGPTTRRNTMNPSAEADQPSPPMNPAARRCTTGRGKGRAGSRLGLKTAASSAAALSPPPSATPVTPPPPLPPPSTSAPSSMPISTPGVGVSSPAAPPTVLPPRPPAQGGGGWEANPPHFSSMHGSHQSPNPWVYPPNGSVNLLQQPQYPQQPQVQGENFHLVGQTVSFNPVSPNPSSVDGATASQVVEEGCSSKETVNIDNIEKIVKVQQDQKVESEKVTEAQIQIANANLQAAKEQKEAKMFEAYNSLLTQDTSHMSEEQKANRDRVIRKLEEKLFA